jgi:hypothetical protein
MIKIGICDDDFAVTASIEAILRRNAKLLPESLHIKTFSVCGDTASIKSFCSEVYMRPYLTLIRGR